MPRPLTATQRGVRTRSTYPRSAARTLARKYGVPFLHAGHDQYVHLADALHTVGTHGAGELSRDPRSVLIWPLYLRSGYAALLLAFGSGHRALSGIRIDIDNPERTTSRNLAQLDLTDDTHPALRDMILLARDIERVHAAPPDATRTSGELCRLLQVVAAGFAAVDITRGQEPDSATILDYTSTLLTNPETLIRLVETHAIVNGTPT